MTNLNDRNALKTLRYFVGIFLATLGVRGVFAAVSHVIQPSSKTSVGWNEVLMMGLGILLLVGAFILLRPTVTAPSKPCPKCGGRGQKAAAAVPRPRGRWRAFFGVRGFPVIWGSSFDPEVRCTQCETQYVLGTKISRFVDIVFLVIIFLLLWSLIGEPLVMGQRKLLQ